MLRRLILIAVVLSLAGGAFAFGLWVGTYQPPFYHRLRNFKRTLSGQTEPVLTSEQRMMAAAFTDAMIADQILPPITSFAEIAERLKTYEVDPAIFPSAYQQLQVLGADQSGDHLAVRYQLAGRDYVAYAYASFSTPKKECASVVVPGSGQNQSSEIFAGNPQNYQGTIAVAMRDLCDPVVIVKPNEDFLAIHNGSRKLNYTAIAVSLLNRGASYSAHYLINALAVVKHLQASYRVVVPMGLSQGGDGALNVAMQSRPAGAVVASGFSIYDQQLTWANLEQVIIPGAYRNFNERVHSEVAASPTRYFFTSGKDEDVTWGLEAETQATCKFLADLPRVRCSIHDGGHIFPLPEVRSFLQDVIAGR
ncbi:MAG: hypothetical protein K2Y23_04680 [Cyanobacteria bacterium]|nr:hypothetical protein [Cyanobacteriota bacterium]